MVKVIGSVVHHPTAGSRAVSKNRVTANEGSLGPPPQ